MEVLFHHRGLDRTLDGSDPPPEQYPTLGPTTRASLGVGAEPATPEYHEFLDRRHILGNVGTLLDVGRQIEKLSQALIRIGGTEVLNATVRQVKQALDSLLEQKV
jgi:hypothetical protein